MQTEPSASEVLTTLADLMEDELLPALPVEFKHKARVAANLLRTIEREQRLVPDATSRATRELTSLLGHSGTLTELAMELMAQLRSGADAELEQSAWRLLVDVSHDDISVAKPGYDAWTGQ